MATSRYGISWVCTHPLAACLTGCYRDCPVPYRASNRWDRLNAMLGNSTKLQRKLFCYLLPLICSCMPCSGAVLMRRASPNRSMGKAAKSGHRAKVRHLALQPDALGVATRLAAGRLREAGIVLNPLLRSAGLSVSQINSKDMRIAVASQIRFLELAAKALKDPLLGFRLARDGELRLAGLLHYVVASSETLGDALDRAQRYSSIANAGLVLKCLEGRHFTIALHYAGVARYSDRQQMECFVTWLVRFCRALTDRRLNPIAVYLVHRRLGESSEIEKFFGCRIEFGAVKDQIVFDKEARQLRLVSADPYLNEILLHDCEQALAYRRSRAGSLRITIENAIAPLLPHGKARLNAVAQALGMSSRTLARKLTAEGLNFGEILGRLRFDLATHYLGEANLSISQIAWLVGYQGVSAFSHSYKRRTGINPRKMRDKLLASH
jgi:AraC-like DNA-binding protein